MHIVDSFIEYCFIYESTDHNYHLDTMFSMSYYCTSVPVNAFWLIQRILTPFIILVLKQFYSQNVLFSKCLYTWRLSHRAFQKTHIK